MTVDMSRSLVERDRLLREIRGFFHDRQFIEVQPPCLARDCVVDPFLDPISVSISEIGLAGALESSGTGALESNGRGSPERYYLQTSPESAMKRMLAQGAPSMFSIGPVFRSDEQGDRHNLEFTMLEWYEVGGDSRSAIGLLGELAMSLFASDDYETITYQEAFQKWAGLDPIECPTEVLIEQVAVIDAGLATSMVNDRDGLLDVILTASVEPNLGQQRPTVLTRYPISQAALARPCHDDPRCAERFELFYRGLELANGYDELLEPDELVRRYEVNNAIRRQHGRVSLPVDTTLVDAMRKGLPQCSGVALGVDRTLMLRMGADRIQDVIALPFDIA